MSYQPTPQITTGVGEPRAWVLDTSSLEVLTRIADTLERIQQQLSIITEVELNPGDKLN